MQTTSQLIRDVRVIIGENENIQPLIAARDDMALERDTLLKTLIAPAIDKVHKLASPKMLRGITEDMTAECSVDTSDEYCARCKMPEEMLFATYVKAPMWDRAVTGFIEGYTQEYDLCRDPHVGIRPTTHFPAVAVVPSETGGMLLELYPKTFNVKEAAANAAGTGAETAGEAAGTVAVNGLVIRGVRKAKGITDSESQGQNTDSEQWAIADNCYWAVVYTIASLYYLSTDNEQRAGAMAKEAAEHLNVDR